MFFRSPGNPTKFKRGVYLIASTILGVELSIGICSLTGIAYSRLNKSQNPFLSLGNDGYATLTLWIFFIILGGVGGTFLGKFWWRKLYIERVWEKK